MNQMEQNPILVEVLFNTAKNRFEVYAFDKINEVQFLMMTLTIDEVREQIKEKIISTLRSIHTNEEAFAADFLIPEVEEAARKNRPARLTLDDPEEKK